MLIETERLLLREYTLADYDALFEIVSDAETMQHYPAPFDEERTRGWISWNLDNYEKYGFGLWALVSEEKQDENVFDPGYFTEGSIKEKMKGVKRKITGFMAGNRKKHAEITTNNLQVREQQAISAEPRQPESQEEDEDATMMLCNIRHELKATLVPREVRIRGCDLPEFVLEGECFSIGKLKDFVEGFLPAGQVSRYHLVLKKKGEKWLAMDMNSTNGTWINNEKMPAYSPYALCDGDRIRIADLEYVFALE